MCKMTTIERGICYFCKKTVEITYIAFYWWMLPMCEKCEKTARDRGHIK